MISTGRKVLSSLVILSLLAACAGESEEPTDSTESSGRGDRVVTAVSAWGSENALPWFQGAPDLALWGMVYDPVVRTDPDTGEPQPGLFASWESSPDATTWTFHLQQGVTFHNGDVLTSSDAKYTVEQLLRDDAVSNISPFLKSALESTETPDDQTFIMHFNRPVWEVLVYFGEGQIFRIVSEEYVEEVGEEEAALRPIGTGKYQFDSSEPGSSYTFRAYDEYWDAANAAGYDELVVRLVPDATARLAGLRAGEIDAMAVSGDSLARAEDEGFRIIRRDNAILHWLVYSGQVHPDFPDYCEECPWVGEDQNAIMVREALSLAVNKQAIIDGLWHGAGTLEPFGPWTWPGQQAWSDEWVLEDYDPERARELLTEAGYPDGFEIMLASAPGVIAQDAPAIMQAVANDWEVVGLNATIVDVDPATFTPSLRARDTGVDVHIYASQYWSEGAAVWPLGMTSKGAFDFAAYYPGIDEAIGEVVAETDFNRRAELQREVGDVIWAGHYILRLGTRSVTWAVSDKIGSDWDPGPEIIFARIYNARP